MKTKKIICNVIACLLLFALTGCSTETTSTETAPTETTSHRDPCEESQAAPEDKNKKAACIQHIEKKIEKLKFDEKKRSI